ncbi:MAG: RsmD family RNA methyltransferase [Bacteroidales bacterium]|nr:RsmD family RNA methyltransferase [Bacteroidales bacterium]MCL2133658.1 RsmD family RNA methyltransferase [Bacteroidales bacterium]
MRIIGGSLRGKTIVPPTKFNARPTTDFAKEALFNMLENTYDFTEIRVLDLFAGAGSISFEFASRGCPHIDCIDINPLHQRFIKETAAKLRLPQIHALRLNAFEFPDICTVQYDIIFADPPYDTTGIDTLPQRIFEHNLVKEGGVFILEHSRQHDFTKDLRYTKHKVYGSVNFSFFEREINNFPLRNL